MITRERKVSFVHRGRSHIDGKGDDSALANGSGPIPRVSRLMALAIYLDKLVHDGVVADQAELARLGHVTRARLTQIMNLLCLAPDIQESILFLTPTGRARDAITEKQLRPIAATASWSKQKQMWRGIPGGQ